MFKNVLLTLVLILTLASVVEAQPPVRGSGSANVSVDTTALEALFGTAAAAAADNTANPTLGGVRGFTMVFDGSTWDRWTGAVTCSNCSGSGASATDGAAFTADTDPVAPLGAVYDTTPGTIQDGDVAAARMSSDRYLYTIFPSAQAVTQSGTWTVQPGNTANTTAWLVTGTGGTFPVTATDLDVQIGGSDSLTIGTFPDNEPFNVAQMNGVAVSMGVGASGTGTQRVAALIHDGTDTALVDGSGNLQITGSVSCSNCTGSGASDVDDSSFGIGTDSVAPAGYLFDDVTPDSVDEGDSGMARMSANRVPYSMIRDAAGNERGANVTANNELLVELGAGSASIGTLGANSGVDIGDVTLTASDVDIGNVDLELAGTAVGETNPVAVRLSNGTSFLSLASDTTVGSAIGTSGPLGLAVYSDFDGSALPTITNVDTEGEGVPVAASIKGVQYMMITNEDGSLERGTTTTPFIMNDVAATTGGADEFSHLSAGATEDEHAVKATAGTLYSITATNTNAAVRYLKCEDDTAANTAPGTDTPELRIAIPGATTGAGFTTEFPKGWAFANALTCWLVTGAADSDVAEVAANEIMVFYTFK